MKLSGFGYIVGEIGVHNVPLAFQCIYGGVMKEVKMGMGRRGYSPEGDGGTAC